MIPIKPRLAVTAFLQRYQHTVTLLSAAAVLAAFLVKDVIRENIKEFLDDVESANRDYRFAEMMVQTNARVLATAQLLTAIVPGRFDNNDPKYAQDRLLIDIRSSNWQLDDIRDRINNLEELWEKFPANAPPYLQQKLDDQMT
jgi:hypothetical protein